MTISEVIEFVKRAHAGQTDRAGVPYINHLATVAHGVEKYGEDYVKVGWLHDVIEDTAVSSEDLLSLGLSRRIVDAVLAMSKREGEDYDSYMRRVSSNDIARVVKISDMTHNSDLGRLKSPTEADRSRRLKYISGISKLSSNDGVLEIHSIIRGDILVESEEILDEKISKLSPPEYGALMHDLRGIIECGTSSF